VAGYYPAIINIHEYEENGMPEEQRNLTQRLEAIGLLAGGLAHDFKNLLTVALGYIELAQIECDASGKVHTYLEKATNALQRSKNLTQQMLMFSRAGVPNKKPIDFGRVLKNAVIVALGESGIKPQCIIEPALWPIEADEDQIIQVIGHLVSNAIHAMPEDGTIEVEASNTAFGPGEFPALMPGNYIKVSLTDHGSGISNDNLPKIFDPFFTTKNGGSGLGLSTSYVIIKNHHGLIEARSEEGHGTTITFFLPAWPAAAGTPEPIPAASN